MATDAKGDIYLTGSTDASLGGPYRGGGYDAWVAKYDAAGHALWKRQLGTEEADVATGVATDAKGSVYLSGETSGSLSGANRGSWDAWVAKYDTAGHALWKRQFGTETGDYAFGVATDAKGDVYVTGDTFGSLGGGNRGTLDAWVAEYDAAGRALWRRQLGTEADENARGVATDAKGNVYLTGNTYGSVEGANRGDSDAWIAKYSTQR